MPFFRKKIEKELEEMEKGLYARTAYSSLKEAKEIIYNWRKSAEEGRITIHSQENYINSLKKLIGAAYQAFFKYGESEGIEECAEILVELDRLPKETPKIGDYHLPLAAPEIKKFEKILDKLLNKYKKKLEKYIPDEAKVGVIVLVTLLSFAVLSITAKPTVGFFSISSDLYISLGIVLSIFILGAIFFLLK